MACTLCLCCTRTTLLSSSKATPKPGFTALNKLSHIIDESIKTTHKLRVEHLSGSQTLAIQRHSYLVLVPNNTHPDRRRFCLVKAKADNKKSDERKKPNSVICADCDGNGAVLCSQCKGSGVNSVDFFNGRFKAGKSCWLCGGKKDVLCGNCNGAGFIGGFMSTFDE